MKETGERRVSQPIPYGMLRSCVFISHHALLHGEMVTALMESVVVVTWGWVWWRLQTNLMGRSKRQRKERQRLRV